MFTRSQTTSNRLELAEMIIQAEREKIRGIRCLTNSKQSICTNIKRPEKGVDLTVAPEQQLCGVQVVEWVGLVARNPMLKSVHIIQVGLFY